MVRGRARAALLLAGTALGALAFEACGLSAGGGAAPDDASTEHGPSPDGRADTLADSPPNPGDAPRDVISDGAMDSPADGPGDGGVEAPADVKPDQQDASCAPCGVQSVCSQGACIPARRVFLSTYTHDGNMGGATAADSAVCGVRAVDANLGGTWMAWVSDSTSSVAARLSHATVGYYLVDGTEIAADWTALLSGPLQNPIDVDAYGLPAPMDVTIWTGTLADGTFSASCSDFGSNAMNATGIFGNNGKLDAKWTNAGSGTCDVLRYVYCFEQ